VQVKTFTVDFETAICSRVAILEVMVILYVLELGVKNQ
jgi:hypothetical protein